MIRFICLLSVVLFCNCHPEKKDNQIINVSVLRGPTAIAFAQWMENPPVIEGRKIVIRIVDTPDLMQAILIRQRTDIAVLPMVNAANLYNKGIHYLLAGCPIWGTLYMVEKADIHPDDHSLYIFGAGANPDIITRYYLEQKGLTYAFDYSFSSAREIMQALYMGKAARAVLGEPFLSTALQRDSTLHIIADLNNPANTSSGFAQTAVLYAPSLKEYRNQLDSLLSLSCRFANEHPQEVIRVLESKNVFPAGTLTSESIKRCQINYLTVDRAKESIRSFLQVMYNYEPKSTGGKLPDDGFITGGKE
ncbi:MAG: ABC transporter substrate-binding protein [Tannerellaceae bacterium]|jgi:NitT/TauT family transport system substrate-binding protein|nr:ABC transporter substrate-binding protein [Tannerellaceae bacterium]